MSQPILRKGDWALVTGATSGMGKAFAEQLAQQGLNIFLIALEEDKLAELSRSWTTTYQIQTGYLRVDLSEPDFVEKIRLAIESKGVRINVLINAAGFGYFGDFGAMSPEQIQKLIQVDSVAIVQLCRLFLPQMQKEKRGVIINIASIAGFVPYPYAAVYSAAKSFVRVFTNAIWAENEEKNIRIIALCPGYTKTNFEKVSTEPSGIHLFPGENPAEIARKTLANLSRHWCTVFTKASHPFKVLGAKLLPLKAFAGLLRYLARRV